MENICFQKTVQLPISNVPTFNATHSQNLAAANKKHRKVPFYEPDVVRSRHIDIQFAASIPTDLHCGKRINQDYLKVKIPQKKKLNISSSLIQTKTIDSIEVSAEYKQMNEKYIIFGFKLNDHYIKIEVRSDNYASDTSNQSKVLLDCTMSSVSNYKKGVILTSKHQ